MADNKEKFDYSKLNFFHPENLVNQKNSEFLNRENNSFPDKLLEKNELAFMVKTVYSKMEKFYSHRCFSYLEKYYEHLERVLHAKNHEKMLIDYSESLKNIQYFSLCWNENKIENDNNLGKI